MTSTTEDVVDVNVTRTVTTKHNENHSNYYDEDYDDGDDDDDDDDDGGPRYSKLGQNGRRRRDLTVRHDDVDGGTRL